MPMNREKGDKMDGSMKRRPMRRRKKVKEIRF